VPSASTRMPRVRLRPGQRQEPKVLRRTFLVTERDLGEFLQWLKGQPDTIVAIEGSGGLSRPIERLLREAGRIFYSFKPADTDKFRRQFWGRTRIISAMRSRRTVCAGAPGTGEAGPIPPGMVRDPQLQPLTRSYERLSQQMTAEINRLWKLLRQAAPELYLALGDSHPEVKLGVNVLKNGGFSPFSPTSPIRASGRLYRRLSC